MGEFKKKKPCSIYNNDASALWDLNIYYSQGTCMSQYLVDELSINPILMFFHYALVEVKKKYMLYFRALKTMEVSMGDGSFDKDVCCQA